MDPAGVLRIDFAFQRYEQWCLVHKRSTFGSLASLSRDIAAVTGLHAKRMNFGDGKKSAVDGIRLRESGDPHPDDPKPENDGGPF